MNRVLTPGGRAESHESTQPRGAPLWSFYPLWFDRIVHLLGAATRNRAAYSYLPESVKRFPAPEGLAATMAEAGLQQVRYLIVAGGIIAIHSGAKSDRTARTGGP